MSIVSDIKNNKVSNYINLLNDYNLSELSNLEKVEKMLTNKDKMDIKLDEVLDIINSHDMYISDLESYVDIIPDDAIKVIYIDDESLNDTAIGSILEKVGISVKIGNLENKSEVHDYVTAIGCSQRDITTFGIVYNNKKYSKNTDVIKFRDILKDYYTFQVYNFNNINVNGININGYHDDNIIDHFPKISSLITDIYQYFSTSSNNISFDDIHKSFHKNRDYENIKVSFM